jgi:hypothetical protein
MQVYEQRPLPVWVLLLIILGGGWLGGTGLILVFDRVSSASASSPRDDAEILRRIKAIEKQHAGIEEKQQVMIDQMKTQASDPTSIAKLQEQYVSLSERMNWVLKGMGLALIGGVSWALKQIRDAAKATSQVRELLSTLRKAGVGGGSLGSET